MLGGLSMSKVRALSGAADQVFSSLSNGLIIYAVAVVTSTRNFGQIALLLTLLAAAIGVLRGSLGTPLLLTAGRDSADVRREGSFAITTALLVSPIVGCVMWAVEGPGIRVPATLIILATPIVLVEDVLRYVAIAEGRAHIAALWDGVWFAGSAALLVATWLHLPYVTTACLIGGWTALAFGALVGLLAAVRIVPRLRHYRAWLADGWQHRARYGVDSGLEQLTVFAVLLFAAVVLNPAVSGALRGATALLAPVAIAVNAIPLAVIPESRRLNTSAPQVWKSLARIAWVTSAGSLVLGVVMFFMPVQVGELVLGSTFEATQSIVVIIAFEYALAAWGGAVGIFLRSFNRSADALNLKICYVLVMLVTVTAAGLIFRTAEGVAAGIATAMTFYVAVALLRVSPWADPDTGSGGEDIPRPAPDSSRPATTAVVTRVDSAAGIAAVGPGRVGVPRPLPLSARLRLHGATQMNHALIALWVFAVLAALGPAMIISATAIPTTASWLWALPATVLCAARLAWLIGSGQRRLFELMFWSYAYVFLGLAPLAQLREHEWPGTVPRIDGTYVGAAELIVIVGCCAFLAGAGLDNVASARRPWRAAKRATDAARQLLTINYSRTVWLCMFAIVLNVYYLSKLGWLQFTRSRYESQELDHILWPNESLGVTIRACSYMALLVSFIALVRFRSEAKKASLVGENFSSTVMRSNMALLIVIGILLADNMNPISNARYQSGTAMLAAATAYGLFATARRFRYTACGFLAGLLVIFPLADAFRVSQQAELKSTNPIQSLLSDDYDSFAQLINGYLIAMRDGIVPGKQLYGVLLFWVPRTMWTNKPVDTGIYIANMRGYGFTNLSAPLWIELFLNGGWLVLAVGMFALGFGLHRWDTRLDAQFTGYRMPGLLGCILPFYMMILLRGSLLQAASFLFFILVFAAFVRRSAKAKAPPATAVAVELRPTWHAGRRRTSYASA